MGLPASGARQCQWDAGISSTAVPPDRRLDPKKKLFFKNPLFRIAINNRDPVLYKCTHNFYKIARILDRD
jgi:hypothetical protein